MTNDKYNHQKVERKWQGEWDKIGLYSPDLKKSKNKFYNLWMFPYPSAEGLHAGHAFASTGSDIYGRFMRMQGKDVFQPIGYDSFGIHSENYAIKIGEDPHAVVARTTKNYERQMRSLGHGYDWTKTVTTSKSDYYKWTQWLFVQMFKAGLAYKKKASVNWCPSCRTVLADEQVMTPKQAGKEAKDAQGNLVKDVEDLRVCERCATLIEKKELEQWFFKITDYADRLLAGLDKINWSQRVIKAQKEWIGKSRGMLISFQVENSKERISVFTTRPDTLNSVTFLATSELYKDGDVGKDKKGEFSGKNAINPLDGRKIPIWKTNYVAPEYGTGIIMGVPAHDERDMDFASKYHLEVINKKPDHSLWERVENEGWGKSHINYHLRDWLVSRQRYWGAPIPMVFCADCGWVPVPENQLPVLLPNISDYKPEGLGKGPLANHPDFYKTSCPKCGGDASRETDVMDTFVDSSWYFLRYPSVGVDDAPFDSEITKRMLPVDLYFGGAEHSVLHLMYARFVTMFLHDQGLIDFEEPFPRFFAHGLMIKDGAKMSKSRGNVVNPDQYIEKYGADTLRLYLVFMGPMDGYPDFRDTGIEGMERFINRLWNAFHKYISEEKTSQILLTKLHQTIKKVSEEIEGLKFNTALSSMMEFLNIWEDEKALNTEEGRIFVKLLAPFAPHLAEEIWTDLFGEKDSIHKQGWPGYDPKLILEENITIVVQVNGKVRGQVTVDRELSGQKEEVEKLASKNEKVTNYLKDRKIIKVIFISQKLINFVVGDD